MRSNMIEGVTLWDTRRGKDERGHSVQVYNPFLSGLIRVCYVDNPAEAHTLRGLHFQKPFKRKLVTCVDGAVYDVVVDLRTESPTYLSWTEIILKEGDSILIGEGLAHGYLTLQPNTSLVYVLEGLTDDNQGIRWNDPKIAIAWPAAPRLMSTRDKEWGLL